MVRLKRRPEETHRAAHMINVLRRHDEAYGDEHDEDCPFCGVDTGRKASMTVSEWLNEEVGSHDIYGIELLADLPEPVKYDPGSDELQKVQDGFVVDRRQLHSTTAAEMEAREGAYTTGNPKGAFLDPDVKPEQRLFGGYSLSMRLDLLLTGADGGADKMGRGFRHRACITHLQEAGF